MTFSANTYNSERKEAFVATKATVNHQMNKHRKSKGLGVFLISALTVCVMLCGMLAPNLSALPADGRSGAETPDIVKLSYDARQYDFEFGDTKLIITQDTANIVKVSGKTVPGIDDLTIILNFGEKSYSLFTKDPGSISEQKFQLDIPYCQSIGNAFEINISYMVNGVLYRSDSDTKFGVVTYNVDNGFLGYPDGATYINKNGEEILLTNNSVPTDARLDDKNGMTIICGGSAVYTIVSSAQYGDVPDKSDCLGGIYTKTDDSLTVYAAPGIEYALSSNNSIITGWYKEINGLITFKELEPDTVYTLVARTPAAENTLPSAYISVISHSTLDTRSNADKAAFDKKFEELKDKLYNKESDTLTISTTEMAELSELFNTLSEEVRVLPEIKEKAVSVEGSKYLSDHLIIINKPSDELSVSDKEALDRAIIDFSALSEESKALIGNRLEVLAEKEKAIAITELSQLDGANDKSAGIQQIVSDYKTLIENAAIIDGSETDKLLSEAEKAIAAQAKNDALNALNDLYDRIISGEHYASYNEAVKALLESEYISGKTSIENSSNYTEVKSASDKALSSILRIDGKEQLDAAFREDDEENIKTIIDEAIKQIDNTESPEKIEEIIGKAKKDILRQRGKNEIQKYISTLNIPAGMKSLIDDIKNNAFSKIDRLETDDAISLEVVRAKAELKLTEKYIELLSSIDKNDPFIDALERNLDSAYFSALSEIRNAADESEIAAALSAGLTAMENAMDSAYLTDFYNKYKDILEKAEVTADDINIINKALNEIRTYSDFEQSAFDEYRNDLLIKKMKAVSRYLLGCKDGYNDKVIDSYVKNIMNGSVDGDTASDNALSDHIDALVKEAELAIEFEKIKTEQKKAISELFKDNENLKDAYDKAMSALDALVFSAKDAAENDNYFADTSKKANEISLKFKEYVDFEAKREELKLAVKNDVDGKIASGKYSDSAAVSLGKKCTDALAALDGVKYSGSSGSVKTLEEIYAKHTALIAEEKIVRLSDGNCEITNENGMNSALSLSFKNSALKNIDKSLISNKKYSVVTGSMTDSQALTAVKDKKTLLTYEISLSDSGVTVSGGDNGIYTVRILLDEKLRSATGLQVVTLSDSGIEILETKIDGSYIEFKTRHFSEFILLGDKEINLTWLAVLLGIILIGELITGIVFNNKQKKKNNKMYSFALPFMPILAVLLTPSGILPAIIVLGTLSVAGGAVLTHQIVKARRADSNNESADTNDESDAPVTEDTDKTVDNTANEASRNAEEQSDVSDDASAKEISENAEEQSDASDDASAKETSGNAEEQSDVSDDASAKEISENAEEHSDVSDDASKEEISENAEEQSDASDDASAKETSENAEEQSGVSDDASAKETSGNAEEQSDVSDDTSKEETSENAEEQSDVSDDASAKETSGNMYVVSESKEDAAEQTKPKSDNSEIAETETQAEAKTDIDTKSDTTPVYEDKVSPETNNYDVPEKQPDEVKNTTTNTHSAFFVFADSDTSDSEQPDTETRKSSDSTYDEKTETISAGALTEEKEAENTVSTITIVNVESVTATETENTERTYERTDTPAGILEVEAPDETAAGNADNAPISNTVASDSRTITILDVEAPDTDDSETTAEERHRDHLIQNPAIDIEETEEEEAERRATAKIVNVYAAAQFANDGDNEDDTEAPEDSESYRDDDDEIGETAIILPDDTEEETALDQTVYASHGQRVYVTYDYSFESKLILSGEDTQRRYTYLSDLLLSYKLGKRRSWKKERYFLKGKNYVQMIFRGKTLCLCMAILPESLENSKYFYENVGQIKKYESVPVMIRIRSGRGCKYAAELIIMMMESAGIHQKYQPEDTFVPLAARERDELVSEGLIKRLMTDGNGDIVAADFEAMKSMKFTLESGMPVLKKVSAEDALLIPDAAAAEFVETEEENDDVITYGRRKGIINIDTISAAFKSGETVTLAALKAKHLVPKNIHFIKVLARGVLDKPLTVKAHDFSMDAVKMIVMAGGNVVKLKYMKI